MVERSAGVAGSTRMLAWVGRRRELAKARSATAALRSPPHPVASPQAGPCGCTEYRRREGLQRARHQEAEEVRAARPDAEPVAGSRPDEAEPTPRRPQPERDRQERGPG